MTRLGAVVGMAMAAVLAASAQAQRASEASGVPPIILPDLGQREHEFDERSGLARNGAEVPSVVWSRLIEVPGADWLRLRFDDVLLAGRPGSPSQSYLRMTSLLDGAVQTLNQVHVRQWNETSAYFNGDSVLVELVAAPGTGDNHVAIVGAWSGGAAPESICGHVDDRVPSDNPRQGRYLPDGCTAWIMDDQNGCLGTAGHCLSRGFDGVVEFNVPLSTPGGIIQHPPPEDQYAVDYFSIRGIAYGPGFDWGYMGAFPNPITGLTPYEAQGARYTLLDEAPPPNGQTIRITGYGTVSPPVDPTWNQVQKTHAGAYVSETGTLLKYTVDTTDGNSGSPVFIEGRNSGVIGVHTHGGCNDVGGNVGTSVEHTGWRSALANPGGVCAPPPPGPDGELFVAAALFGEIGAVSPHDGTWGVATNLGLEYDGMAYDRNATTFYLVGSVGPVLYRMEEGTWDYSAVGTITGGPTRFDGLAYNPFSDTLYGVGQSDRQLYRISTSTAQATPIGDPGDERLTSLAYHENLRRLYGIAEQRGGSRLIRIDTQTGVRSLVGGLGNGISSTDGLAWRKFDNTLYTIDNDTNGLHSVDPATGAATFVVTADLHLATSYGMAAGSLGRPSCPADLDRDGDVDVNDFFLYLDFFAAGDPRADIDGDGDIDANDFFAYLDLFAAGC